MSGHVRCNVIGITDTGGGYPEPRDHHPKCPVLCPAVTSCGLDFVLVIACPEHGHHECTCAAIAQAQAESEADAYMEMRDR